MAADSDEVRAGAPSNAQLAERMARVEAKQDATVQTLDRIEGRLTTTLDDHGEQIGANDERVSHLVSRYGFIKWTIVAAGTVGSGLGALATSGLLG